MAKTNDQFSALRELFDEEDLDFWSPPRSDESTTVMVNQNQESDLRSFLHNLAMNYSVVIDDIEK